MADLRIAFFLALSPVVVSACAFDTEEGEVTDERLRALSNSDGNVDPPPASLQLPPGVEVIQTGGAEPSDEVSPTRASLQLPPGAGGIHTGAAEPAAENIAAAWTPPACEVWAGDHRGLYICGTDPLALHQHANGTWELFVVGIDFAVWHSWGTDATGWSFWHSLGGQVRCANGPPCNSLDGVVVVGPQPKIAVIGTDGRLFCKTWPWIVDWKPCSED